MFLRLSMLAGPRLRDASAQLAVALAEAAHPRSTFESLRSTLSSVEGSRSRGDFAPRSGRRRYCTAVLALVFAGFGAGPATGIGAAPIAPQIEPIPGEATFTVFIRGTDVGREQVNLSRSGTQWVITSTGRLGDFTLNRFELKYAADWQPIELRVEGTQAGKDPKTLVLATSFALTSAINEITQNGVTNAKTDQISARTIVLPSNVFAGYEALAARLANSRVGEDITTYVAANAEVKVSVRGVTDEAVATPAGSSRRANTSSSCTTRAHRRP